LNNIDGQIAKSETDISGKAIPADAGKQDLGGKLLSEPQPEQLAYHRSRHGYHGRPTHHHNDHDTDRRSHRHGHTDDAPSSQSDKPASKDKPAVPDAADKQSAADKLHAVVTKTEEAVSSAVSYVLGPIKRLPSAHGFASAMSNYWHKVSIEKTHHRYETAFPPVYPGMDRPRDIPPLQTNLPPNSIRSTGHLPSLENLLSASKDLNRIVSHDKSKSDFQYLALTEPEFKKRYAAESVHVGKDFNLNKDQMANLVKRVYAFEGGGWSTYYTLSSMPQEIMDDSQKDARLKFHPSSSAIGYNQLLMKDTVNDIIQHGSAISTRLNELALEEPARADVLHAKAQMVDELHDVLVHKSTPFNKPPNKHSAFYTSSARIEQATQALNLDGDVGPVIQSQELYNLLKFSRDNKIGDYLNVKTSLETSHAAEYDKLEPEKKLAAVAELMDHIKPSPMVAAKPELTTAFNATVESLRLKFIELGLPPTPDNPEPNKAIERDHLSNSEFRLMNSQVLTIRRYGGDHGPLSPEARALLDKVTFDYFGGYRADQLQAAAIELANLAGMGTAQTMLNPSSANLPTSNFFAKNGYEGNPVTSRRSADELLLQIYRIMHGPNSDPTKQGMKQFNDAFESLPENPASH
jgi:hypothetical protein